MTDASLSDTVKSTTSDAADAVAEQAVAAADSVKDAAATVGTSVDRAAATAQKTVPKTVDSRSAAAAVPAKAGKAAGPTAPESPGPPPVRSLDEIEAELDATRARLAGRINDLQDYVAPKNVMDRQVAKVKGVFVDEYGGIKPDRVLIAVGVVAVVVGWRVLRRRRRG